MGPKSQLQLYLEKIYKLLNTNFDRAFGLDISDSSIELAELSKLFKFSLENYGRIELEDGIIENGKVLDEAKLIENIKKLLANVKPHHVSTNKVVLALPESQVFIHHFTSGITLKGTALRNWAQKEIAKILPIQPEFMYWDMRTRTLPSGDTHVVFVGIKKDIAESYIRVCNSAGLIVVGFGLDSLSIARLLLNPGNTVTAIIDIGSKVTNVSVVRGNDDLCMGISIEKGGYDMTKAIAHGQDIDIQTAENKKISVGSGNSEELYFLIDHIVTEISKEVRNIVEYYEKVFKHPIDKILLVGGGSVMGGIKEKMSEIVGRPIETFLHYNNLENINRLMGGVKSNPYNVNHILFTSVIGLSMIGASNEFQDINLLKQIPSSKINNIDRRALLRSGYLSRLTAIRIFLNSRIMLLVTTIFAGSSILLFGYTYLHYRPVDQKIPESYGLTKESDETFGKSFEELFPDLVSDSATTTTATSTTATSTSPR